MNRPHPLAYLAAEVAGVSGEFPEPDWTLPQNSMPGLAARHRVTSLVRLAPSFERLDAEVQEKITAAGRRQTLRTLERMSGGATVLEAITRSGTPVIVLKGTAFSEVLYGSWAARGVSADLDVLVPPESLTVVHRVLLELGYRSNADGDRQAPLWGWRGTYNRLLHYERSYSMDGRLPAVDVHWRITAGRAPWTSFDSVNAGRRTVQLPIGTVETLGHWHALAVAADQGEIDSWPDLRTCIDFLAAWEGRPSASSLAASSPTLRRLRRLRAKALSRIATPLEGSGAAAWEAPSGAAALAQLWRSRRASDTAVTAAVRGALGSLLPARKLMPSQSPERT